MGLLITDSGDGRGRRASAIAFEQVTKFYPGTPRPAVEEVSLTIAPGRFVVLLGPSGCGKTTLLKMVNRLYDPTFGRIFLDGTDIRSIPAPRLRRQIGYVIQQAGLFPHMRVEENIAVVPKLLGWEKGRIERRVIELLTLIGLPPEEYRRRYPAHLSGGEQQRVGLARALAAEPTTLLMDEPFGALDAITRTRLQEELRRIHRQFGQTILFVTHDIEEAVRLADEIVVMRLGRIVQYGSPLEIVMHPVDDFVADLVGADDVLRRLSLIRVSDLIQEPPAPGGLEISLGTDARTALSRLLESGAGALTVVDEDARRIGTLDLAAIQAASMPRADALVAPVAQSVP